jgi:hypothetical protein
MMSDKKYKDLSPDEKILYRLDRLEEEVKKLTDKRDCRESRNRTLYGNSPQQTPSQE